MYSTWLKVVCIEVCIFPRNIHYTVHVLYNLHTYLLQDQSSITAHHKLMINILIYYSSSRSENLWDRKDQWGRRLEGWPNTAARLAGWRRVTQQGVILYMKDGPCRLPGRPHHLPRTGAVLLLNVHKTPSWATSRKEGMAWYSSKTMPSFWAGWLAGYRAKTARNSLREN